MSFIIVGKEQPVYELDMSGRREDVARMAQYVLHASLDMVDVNVWTTNATLVVRSPMELLRSDEELLLWLHSTKISQIPLRAPLNACSGT